MNLTPLLVRARDAGLTVRVDAGDLVVTPRAMLTPEIRAELLQHKPELVEALTWSESVAHTLLKDAMAYLAEFFIKSGSQAGCLVALDRHEDAIDAAVAEEDMFALRVAVREWVQAGVGSGTSWHL